MRAHIVQITDLPQCGRCGATPCPDDGAATWDAKKQGKWLRGVKFLRAQPEFNRTELICMECGCTWSVQGLPENWQKLEHLAQRPEPIEVQRARETRLEYDDDPPIPEEMLGEMPEMPAELAETTTVPSIKEEMAKLNEEHPELLAKAQPWQHQLKTLLAARPDLVKG